MKKNFYIVTGTSRGLGKAFVDSILQNYAPAEVICIGRNFPSEHITFNKVASKRLHFIKVDLALPALIKGTKWTKLDLLKSAKKVFFINNAGSIYPINKIGSMDSADLVASINVNAAWPSVLTNHMVKIYPKKEKILVNITSGAAIKPIEGWAAYCASKAYTKMFYETLSMQMERNGNIKVHQIDPGVLDTDMQLQIRNSDSSAFPKVNDFTTLKASGKLKSARDAADKILLDIQYL
jgi:benzil reductase ((S)-benzoin forming)